MATTGELLGEERREQILRWLATEGKVLASDLGERLGVSLDTVRRDLQELAAAGALRATVIAMSPDIAVALADHPGLTVDVLGGRLHPDARTVTGAETIDALRRVRPDVCMLSACSLHPAVGVTLRDRDEALVVG